MNREVLLNGRFVPEAKAVVSVFDGGWLHGAGLFETMRAEQATVFRMESHLERLRRSASALLRPMDQSVLPTPDQFRELLARNGLTSARLRLTVSAGSMLTSADDESVGWTVCATASPLTPYPASMYDAGIQVMICPFKQSAADPTAGHKTTGYLPRLVGLRESQKARCFEALWFNPSNELAEGCISNVFLVKGGTVRTPPLSTPVLPGITRAAVLELAASSNIETQEAGLSIHDLLSADECFLTNAMIGIMPVVRVERHDIEKGKVGSTTKFLRREYIEWVRRDGSAAV